MNGQTCRANKLWEKFDRCFPCSQQPTKSNLRLPDKIHRTNSIPPCLQPNCSKSILLPTIPVLAEHSKYILFFFYLSSVECWQGRSNESVLTAENIWTLLKTGRQTERQTDIHTYTEIDDVELRVLKREREGGGTHWASCVLILFQYAIYTTRQNKVDNGVCVDICWYEAIYNDIAAIHRFGNQSQQPES